MFLKIQKWIKLILHHDYLYNEVEFVDLIVLVGRATEGGATGFGLVFLFLLYMYFKSMNCLSERGRLF